MMTTTFYWMHNEMWLKGDFMGTSYRKQRTYTREFKHKIVLLYNDGMRKCDIVKEYGIAYPTVERWIKHESSNGSYVLKDIELCKKNEQLELENDKNKDWINSIFFG